MQIHELNNYNGELDSTAFVAVDNGDDTGKVSIPDVLSNLNDNLNSSIAELSERIDNIIAGGDAPSASEITDARQGIYGNVFASLGKAIRTQIEDVDDEISLIAGVYGKNIFNPLYLLLADGWSENNGIFSGQAGKMTTCFGSVRYPKLSFKPLTRYTFSLKAYTDGSASTAGVGPQFVFHYSDGTASYLNLLNSYLSETPVSISTSEGKSLNYITIQHSTGGNNTWYFSEIQLEEGLTATEYEKYNSTAFDKKARNIIGDTDINPQAISFINDKNIRLSYNIGDTVPISPETSYQYRYAIVECKEGDQFVLNCSGGINPRAYGFLDENNTLIAVAGSELTLTDATIVAPKGSAKCIINDKKTGGVCTRFTGTINDLSRKINQLQSGNSLNAEIVETSANDVFSFVRGIKFGDAIQSPLIDFKKPGDLMVHVSTFTILNGTVYCSYYANTQTAQEDPTKHIVRLAYCSLEDPSDMVWLDVQSVGDTFNGQTITAIYDTILMRINTNTIYVMWTARIGDVYYRLYCPFNIATKTLGSIEENNFYVGNNGNTWNTTNMESLLTQAEIDHKKISGDIGLMQKLTSRVESGVTWYYSGCYAEEFNCIVKSADLINWYFVATPDFENNSMWENATYLKNDIVYYFVRQKSDNNCGFLTYYDLTTKSWADPVYIYDCQSRSDFFEYNGNLFLVHAPLNRWCLAIVLINQSNINQSYDLQCAALPRSYFYPYVDIYNSEIYMSCTEGREHIYLCKIPVNDPTDQAITAIFKTLLNL